MTVKKELLDILACPKCKGDLQYEEKMPEKYLSAGENALICNSCKLLYPVKEDIPIMLIDEAIRLEM